MHMNYVPSLNKRGVDRGSSGKNVIFSNCPTQYVSILICSIRYQYEIMKCLFTKLTITA